MLLLEEADGFNVLRPFTHRVNVHWAAKPKVDSVHWGLAGTRLLTGEARLRVIYTGAQTFYGETVRSATSGRPPCFVQSDFKPKIAQDPQRADAVVLVQTESVEAEK